MRAKSRRKGKEGKGEGKKGKGEGKEEAQREGMEGKEGRRGRGKEGKERKEGEMEETDLHEEEHHAGCSHHNDDFHEGEGVVELEPDGEQGDCDAEIHHSKDGCQGGQQACGVRTEVGSEKRIMDNST